MFAASNTVILPIPIGPTASPALRSTAPALPSFYHNSSTSGDETTEEQIRARFAAEAKQRHAKWAAQRGSAPLYDLGDEAARGAEALEVGRNARSTFTPIHSLADYTTHVHPAAFAFMILFDVPVWRRLDGVNRECHSLTAYYTDSATLSKVLRQQGTGKALHLLGGKWTTEGGDHDQDVTYFTRVSDARLFGEVDVATRTRLMQLWGLGGDGGRPTLISLGHIFGLADDLELHLSRSAASPVTRTFHSMLAVARSSLDVQSRTGSARSYLQKVVLDNTSPLTDLLNPDKYMSYEEWWQNCGTRVRAGESYTVACKGLLLAWRRMCRVIGSDMNELEGALVSGEHVLHARNVSVSNLWDRDEQYVECRDRAISFWQQGGLWMQEQEGDASKQATRICQGESMFKQWYRDLVVEKCVERIDAVRTEINTVAEVQRKEERLRAYALFEMLMENGLRRDARHGSLKAAEELPQCTASVEPTMTLLVARVLSRQLLPRRNDGSYQH